MGPDFSSILKVLLAEGHLFSEHAGLDGTGLKKVGPIQYAVHWLYGVSEPTILRIVDWILRRRFLTDTALGRRVLYLIAAVSWYFPHGVVVTTDAACRMVDFIEETEGLKGARIAVGPCVCQRAMDRWQEPSKKDMVLLYGADIYFHLDIGYELITAADAREMLKEFDRAGLVHVIDFCLQSGKWTFVICNCEDKICAPMRVYLLTGKIILPGPELILHDAASCLGAEKCGKCIERCIFGVNSAGPDGTITLDTSKCMGCGLCVATCLGKARHMTHRPDYRHDHQIASEILLRRKTRD